MGIGKTIGKATVTGLLCGGLVTGAGSAYGNERFNNFAAGVARGMIRQGYESSVDEAARRSYGNRRGSGERNRRDRFTITRSEKNIITQIRKMPRIIYRGDVDRDGLEDFDFCKPGINDCYGARRGFENKDGSDWSTSKFGEFFKEGYYYVENGEWKKVPENTLVIWYHDPGMNFD